MKLCDAYNVNYSKNMKKEQLALALKEQIMDSQHMINCEVFKTAAPSTSQQPPQKRCKRSKSTSNGNGIGKGKSSKSQYFCGKCVFEYQEGEEWIQCDICNVWYHRVCAGLESDENWEHVQNAEVEWVCHQCK